MLSKGNSNINTLTVQQDTTCNGSITLSNNLALGGKLVHGGADALSFDGSGNMSLHKPVQFPNGFTATATCGFTANCVFNEVAMNALNTPAIYLQMPGLSSSISVDGAPRLSFTQIKTQVIGDLEVLGDISGTIAGLDDYQKHASAHLQAVGCESNAGLANVSLHDYPAGWDTLLDWGGGTFQKVCNNVALAGNANVIADSCFIDFDIPAGAKSCLCHLLCWVTGGYCDVYAEHSNGERLWVNRLLLFGPGELINTPDGAIYSGRCVKVAAGHIAGDWTKLRFQGRRGAFNILSVAFQTEVIPQETLGFIHSDCITGDPNSLSDSRLKSQRTLLSGQQAQNVLNQIKSYTYDREDLDQRRVGLIADEVESAIDQLAIDNVVSSKWHNGGQYKTLDYSRLVSWLIPVVNKLLQAVADLKSIINGAA